MAKGDVIFVISPGYLSAVNDCMSKYRDFALHGFSAMTRALDSLERTPSYSYLGFAYINKQIEPADVNDLRVFINKVNIMYEDLVDPNEEKSRVPFLFILSSKEGKQYGTHNYVLDILKDIDTHNLLLMYYDFAIMTDVVIKTQMFGTILLKNRTFELQTEDILVTENRTLSMGIDLPFDDKFIDLFAEKSFIEVDPFLKKYGKSDLILYHIRRYLYDNDPDTMNIILSLIENLDFSERIFYNCCLNNLDLVERGFNNGKSKKETEFDEF